MTHDAKPNVGFLRALARGHEGKPWVTAFAEDPKSAGVTKWGGHLVRTVPDIPSGLVNAYFSTGLFLDGVSGRRLDRAIGVMAVVLDDISLDDVDALAMPPSWVLETSPANCQVGYALVPGEPIEAVSELLRALRAAGLGVGPDIAGNNPVRYVRLPHGINSKGSVVMEHGAPFHCRLVEPLHVARRYTIEDLALGFGADLAAPKGPPRVPVDGPIEEGKRNAALTSMAGTMRRRGMSEAAIVAALAEENLARCQPPLPDAEVATIARSVARYAPEGGERGQKSPTDDVPPDPGIRPARRTEPVTPPPAATLIASEDELAAAHLAPRCIVRDHTYADVALVAAPGGTGKSTVMLWEVIHIAIGRPLHGLGVDSPGWVLYVAAEDRRPQILARLRELLGAMDLTAAERAAAVAGVRVWDVTGLGADLVEVRAGAIVPTGLADAIVAAYRDDPPVIIVIDPLAAMGGDEGQPTAHGAAVIAAARRIVRGLDCCVRLVHHTGQAAARAATVDQYAARGGSALPDGARMVTVLARWEPGGALAETPPPGCSTDGGAIVMLMARAKLSYAPPQPPIWLRRVGWAITWHYPPPRLAPAALRSIQADQVDRYLAAEIKAGRYHTRTTLDTRTHDLGLSRAAIRAGLAELTVAGRVAEMDLPPDRRQGGRQRYVWALDPAADVSGVPQDQRSDPAMPDGPSTPPPPIAHRCGGGVPAPPPHPPCLHPAGDGRRGTAGWAGYDPADLPPAAPAAEVEL